MVVRNVKRLEMRLCLSCSHAGCCNSSKNKHGTKHFHSTGHPVIKSAEPGENWTTVMIFSIKFVYQMAHNFANRIVGQNKHKLNHFLIHQKLY
jgi:hypothetical protein